MQLRRRATRGWGQQSAGPRGEKRSRIRCVIALATILGLTVACTTDRANKDDHSGPRASEIVANGWDFDGDGDRELVEMDAGLRVFSGSAEGYSQRRMQRYSPSDLGVPSKRFEHFGNGSASGDLDGDGFDDLILCPSYHRTDGKGAGRPWMVVGALFGSEQGLSAWTPIGPKGGRSTSSCSDVAMADVDGDAVDDVIVTETDRIWWARGGEQTRSESSGNRRTIDKARLIGGIEYRDFDHFGMGDFNGDGRPDLIYGRADIGANPEGDDASGDAPNVVTRLGTGDGFRAGGALSTGSLPDVGDVNGDGFDDIVLYDPSRVEVAYGSKSGIDTDGKPTTLLDLAPDNTGLDGVAFPRDLDPLTDDRLAMTDIDKDGFEDIVVQAAPPAGRGQVPGRLVVLPGHKGKPRPTDTYQLVKEDDLRPRTQSLPSFQPDIVPSPGVTDKRGPGLIARWRTDDHVSTYVFDQQDRSSGGVSDQRDGEQGRDDDQHRRKPTTEAAPPWDFAGNDARSLVIPAPSAEPDGAIALFDPTENSSAPEGERIDPSTRKGRVLAEDAVSGDFDSDGYADLVTCGEGLQALFGSRDGLDEDSATPIRRYHGHYGEPDCSELSVADLDEDGFDDLLVGGGTYQDLGWVRGGRGMRTTKGWKVRTLAEGRAATTGDVNGDGNLDIAYNGPDGLRLVLGDGGRFEEGGLGSDTSVRLEDMGDVDGDGFDDLVGAKKVRNDEYNVVVWYGSDRGPKSEPGLRLSAEDVGVSGSDSFFGSDVAVDDIDDDGYAEVAIGAPGAEVAGVRAGAVVVVAGSPDGPLSPDATVLSQGSVTASGEPEEGDEFGASVEYRDLLSATGPELVVGSPGEDDDEGKVQLIGSDGEVRQFRPEDAGLDPSGARLGGD